MIEQPTRRRALLGYAAFVAALAGVTAIVVIAVHAERLGGVGPGRYRLLTLILIWEAVAIFSAACLKFVKPRRLAGALIVASLLALPVASLTRNSQISDDLYRYAWDGRLQAAGVDPYRYAPDAPELTRFRDSWLWPDAATCVRLGKKVDASNPQHACTRINRPAVRTIYPPAAEGYFLFAHWLPGPDRDHKLQLDAAFLSAALAGLLAFGLKRTGRDPLTVAYYSFGPLAGLDIASDAHVDVLAALFGVGAILVATLKPRARAWAGALVGLAVAVKLYPALLLPAVLRRQGGWRGMVQLAAAAVGVVALGYLPHILAIGPHLLGYLPGYLHEENYDSGTRFMVLGLLGLSEGVTKALAGLVLIGALAAAAVQCARDRLTPAEGALLVFGAAFLVATPSQPWYALILLCVTVLTGRLEWLAVVAAPYALYFTALLHENTLLAGRWSYGIAAAIVLLASVVRVAVGIHFLKGNTFSKKNTRPTANRSEVPIESPSESSEQPATTTGQAFS